MKPDCNSGSGSSTTESEWPSSGWMDGVLVGAAGWFTLATKSSLCELAALHRSKAILGYVIRNGK